MSDKDKVIGKALYLELRSSNQTYQILITPDGASTNGKNVVPLKKAKSAKFSLFKTLC